MLHHNKFIKQLLILLIIFFCIGITYSQDIVTVNIQQPPLNQLRIEHLWKITLNNTSPDVLNVYLYGTLTEQKDGTVLTAKTSSINLSPGLKNINVYELEPISVAYPNADSKYREALIRTGNMPSGEYEICVYIKYKSNNNNCGSDCIQHSIEIIPAPTLIYPTDSEKAVTRPLFTWMQAVRPGLDIRYKIRIVEIKDNQSPETAMKTNPAWFEESNIMTNIFPYPVSAKEFADSGMYAWQIQSYGFSGNPLGENNGLSEIMSFIYIGKSTEPIGDVIAFPNDIDVIAFPNDIDGVDSMSFQWSYKKESDSNTGYSIKIVEVLENQTPKTAIKENEAFLEWLNILDTFFILPETDKEFIPGKEYAWQVSVYEGNSKIDECKVSSLIISAKKESELDVLFPKVGEELDADAINFQWSYKKQSDSNPSYSIKIVEVLENQTPETAIRDNEIFMGNEGLRISEVMIQPEQAFTFSPGKKYAWQISVFEGDSLIAEGDASYFMISSEKSTELDVLFPKVGEELDADGLILEWKNYDVTDVSIRYSLKIVEVYENQTHETAIENNEIFFEKSDLETPKYLCYLNSSLSFDNGKKYAWRVTVHKGGEIVGKSSIGSFIVKSSNE